MPGSYLGLFSYDMFSYCPHSLLWPLPVSPYPNPSAHSTLLWSTRYPSPLSAQNLSLPPFQYDLSQCKFLWISLTSAYRSLTRISSICNFSSYWFFCSLSANFSICSTNSITSFLDNTSSGCTSTKLSNIKWEYIWFGILPKHNLILPVFMRPANTPISPWWLFNKLTRNNFPERGSAATGGFAVWVTSIVCTCCDLVTLWLAIKDMVRLAE